MVALAEPLVLKENEKIKHFVSLKILVVIMLFSL